MAVATLARPKQLDIIADTVLARDPRLAAKKYCASSTVKPQAPLPEKYCASSTVTAIDKRRKLARMSHEDLCRLAKLSVRNWFRVLRGEQKPSAATLRKLEAALAAPREVKPLHVIAGFHRLVIALCADAVGADRAAVLAADMSKQRPANAIWLRAAQIQMMATYITAVELEVGNAELGRAIGQSRQSVQKARNRVEDLRDDAVVDAALSKVAEQVSLR